MPDTPAEPFIRRHRGYPGREQLDAVNMRFRRAVARLAREGAKDPATAAKLAPIIAEAVEALERLTAQASQAEGSSAGHRGAMEREQAKLDRLARRAGITLRPAPTTRAGRADD
ncbi:hypothetical protein [Streptomyces sp. ISL-100]|uniref:hypothetical protein n=1 Tax=Streptomyces sp. ISL-100 TaxID=2819173 RepID=UPI001BE9D8E3|nr:hypothetical protein [Streptomyces sp. ISL-100]MBT2397231.1 hypothetical protein [Streptomyces sp. ISL-100]